MSRSFHLRTPAGGHCPTARFAPLAGALSARRFEGRSGNSHLRLGALLIAGGLLIGLGACSPKRDADEAGRDSGPAPAASDRSRESAGGSSAQGEADLLSLDHSEAPALDPATLPGQLIAIAASQSGVSNRASSFELLDGRRETLWVTEEGGNVSDWSPSPDRRRVAYRMIQRAPGEPTVATESILVQSLEANAEAIELAQTDTALARLAGFAWSPKGDSLAYGRQIGGLAGAGPESSTAIPSWELRTVLAEAPNASSINDRVVWRLEGAAVGPNNLSLAAWDPASERAALVELAGDSGMPGGVRIIDLDRGEEVARIPSSGSALHSLPSPDGRLLALSTNTASGHEMQLIELASAETWALASAPGRSSIQDPIWSPDDRWLSWDLRGRSEAPESGAAGSAQLERYGLRLLATAKGGSVRKLAASQADSWPIPLAFSPSGRHLLFGEVDAEDDIVWDRLIVVDLETGARAVLGWQLPLYTWSVYWLD